MLGAVAVFASFGRFERSLACELRRNGPKHRPHAAAARQGLSRLLDARRNVMKQAMIAGLSFVLGLAGATKIVRAQPGNQQQQQTEQSTQAQQQSTQAAPKVKVGTNLKAKAAAPAPSASAQNVTKKSTIGKGAASVQVAQPSSFWTEAMDVDDDGNVETSDFLYDAAKGVLYTYREDDFSCPDGKPESGGILEALYTEGNKEGKPVGSGWYIVDLNAGQCRAQKLGTYGCKFDAMGNPTGCGLATINYATGEINVVMAR